MVVNEVVHERRPVVYLRFNIVELSEVYMMIGGLLLGLDAPHILDDASDGMFRAFGTNHPYIDVTRCPAVGVRVEQVVALSFQDAAFESVLLQLLEQFGRSHVDGLIVFFNLHHPVEPSCQDFPGWLYVVLLELSDTLHRHAQNGLLERKAIQRGPILVVHLRCLERNRVHGESDEGKTFVYRTVVFHDLLSVLFSINVCME